MSVELGSLLLALVVALAGAARWAYGARKRRHAEATAPEGIRVTFDRARGDPGFVVWIENRRSVPVKVKAWGVMNAADAPERPTRARVLPAERWGPEFWADLSLFETGNEVVEPMDRWMVRVGRDGATNPRVQTTDALVAWAQVEAVGLVFSEEHSGPWARSDYLPRGCKCGHDIGLHARVVSTRSITRRRRIAEEHGACSASGCGCRRFRLDKKLSPLDVKFE